MKDKRKRNKKKVSKAVLNQYYEYWRANQSWKFGTDSETGSLEVFMDDNGRDYR